MQTQISSVQNSVPEHISLRLRAIRYIGILGVVFCHAVQSLFYFFLGDYIVSPELHQKLADSQLIAILHSLVIYGLFYGAVPMFFLFSAYLQGIKALPYGQTLWRRVRSLALPFALWTVLNIALLYSLKLFGKITFFPGILSGGNWQLWLKVLFGNYSNAWIRGTHCPAIMFQFWFIRDLFVLILISPVIGFLVHEKKRGICFLIFSGTLLAMGYRPVIVGGDALFYYSTGLFFAYHKIDFLTLLDRFWTWGHAILLVLCSIVWMYCKYDGNPDPDTPMWVQLSSCLLLMKYSAVIANSKILFRIAENLDGQAFFLYCAHSPILMLFFTYPAYVILSGTSSSILLAIAIIAMGILNVCSCTVAGILLKRYCPRVFALLTGGRKAAAGQ